MPLGLPIAVRVWTPSVHKMGFTPSLGGMPTVPYPVPSFPPPKLIVVFSFKAHRNRDAREPKEMALELGSWAKAGVVVRTKFLIRA